MVGIKTNLCFNFFEQAWDEVGLNITSNWIEEKARVFQFAKYSWDHV